MHTTQACVVTCIDFRFQDFINKWISENLPPKGHDRVAFAGACKNVDIVLGQIEISKKLHDIKQVIFMNHEDCGAYGESGTHEKHCEDLNSAAAQVNVKFQDIEVKNFFIHLDGTFEEVN